MPVSAQEAVLSGTGIHTGLSSEIRIRRRDRSDDGLGLRFFWPGWQEPITAQDLSSLRRHAKRATILEGEHGETFRTPEHLLAAALFFSEAPLDIHCSAGEPPGLDGSAEPFYRALAEMIPEGVIPHRWTEYDSKLQWEYEGPEGQLRASPSPSFSVDYRWDKTPFKEGFQLTDAATAVREVLPARTFILYREWRKAKEAADLLAGVNMDSGLLFAESMGEFEAARRDHPEFRGRIFPLLHPESQRTSQEPVRHKILDLMGDLALKGLALPRLRLEIRNGGHALNHLLLEQLLHE